MSKNINYMNGDKWNMLTFVKEVKTDTCHRKALFKCDCGQEKVIQISNVRKGASKSCGCYNQLKLKNGQKFNYWTYIRDIDEPKSPRHALFQCDCGREKVVNVYSVKFGKSKSCGCFRDKMDLKKSIITISKITYN